MLAIYGAGGFGLQILDVVEDLNEPFCVVSDDNPGTTQCGVPVRRFEECRDDEFVIAIASGRSRERLDAKISRVRPLLAAPSALISRHALIGDGAFHYNPVVGSFGAAQEHALPVLVVLFDNAGYLSQKGDVIHEYPNGDAVRSQKFAGTSIHPRPDYALLAQAYGGMGECVQKPAEVRGAIQRALNAVANGQLALIDVVLAPVNPGNG